MRKEFANVVRNVVSVVLTLLGGLFVSSPAVAQNQAPPPSRSDAAATTPLKSDGASVAIDPKTYVIGAQDILMIKVWREQDFTGPYTVRPDGKISVPLVGDVQASGLTPERLGDQLKQALSNAGGFRDFANKKKIIVIRGTERIKFNYQDILKGKSLEQNIFLENGDTIVVP